MVMVKILKGLSIEHLEKCGTLYKKSRLFSGKILAHFACPAGEYKKDCSITGRAVKPRDSQALKRNGFLFLFKAENRSRLQRRGWVERAARNLSTVLISRPMGWSAERSTPSAVLYRWAISSNKTWVSPSVFFTYPRSSRIMAEYLSSF